MRKCKYSCSSRCSVTSDSWDFADHSNRSSFVCGGIPGVSLTLKDHNESIESHIDHKNDVEHFRSLFSHSTHAFISSGSTEMNAATRNDAVGNLVDMKEMDPSSNDAIRSMLSRDALFCGDTERHQILQVLEASSPVGEKRNLQKASPRSCAGNRFSLLMSTDDEESLAVESEDRQHQRRKGNTVQSFATTNGPQLSRLLLRVSLSLDNTRELERLLHLLTLGIVQSLEREQHGLCSRKEVGQRCGDLRHLPCRHHLLCPDTPISCALPPRKPRVFLFPRCLLWGLPGVNQ